MHAQLGNEKMQIREEIKGIWKRGKRLRSIMMVWQGHAISFLSTRNGGAWESDRLKRE